MLPIKGIPSIFDKMQEVGDRLLKQKLKTMDNLLEQKTDLIDKNLLNSQYNEAYNMGIDAAINFCKSQEQMYKALFPNQPQAMVIESIIKTLEHFKK